MIGEAALLIASLAAQAAASETFTVVAVGDCMPGGVYQSGMCAGADPWVNLRSFLSGAGLAIGNLEGPLTDRGGKVRGKKFTFRAPPESARQLSSAGLDVVGLANNHIMDFGQVGLADTREALARFGLLWCGAGRNLAEARRPALARVGDCRVAVLAYSRTFPQSFWAGPRKAGTAFARPEWVAEDVARARKENDVVIVLVHWGVEKRHTLRAYQQPVARAALEAGAALVIGAHPHVAQGMERIGNGVAVYSLGDGVFGGASGKREGSLLLRATFASGVLREIELLPLETGNAATKCAPRLMPSDEGKALLEQVRGLSGELGSSARLEDGGPEGPRLVLGLSSD